MEILLAENPFISPTVNQAARSMAGYAKSIIRYEGIVKRTKKLTRTNTEVYIKFCIFLAYHSKLASNEFCNPWPTFTKNMIRQFDADVIVNAPKELSLIFEK